MGGGAGAGGVGVGVGLGLAGAAVVIATEAEVGGRFGTAMAGVGGLSGVRTAGALHASAATTHKSHVRRGRDLLPSIGCSAAFHPRKLLVGCKRRLEQHCKVVVRIHSLQLRELA